ncbi:MAG: hypothetical protein NC324_09060 [Bacteroides sp.]|nr:hypothetical protein [Bacteroides sp.]
MKRRALFLMAFVGFLCLHAGSVAQEYYAEKKQVAILGIIDVDNAFPRGVKRMVRGFLTDEITRTPGYEGFTREDISSVALEHDFQRSGMVDPDQVKEYGKMTGAQYIVILEMVKMDDYNISYISQIIDVETGRIANSGTLYAKNDAADYASSCKSMARKLLYNL